MPDVTDAHLDRMTRAIVDEVDPEQVILFGSRARGDARPDSDVDLLVIESEPFGPDRCHRTETERVNRALDATPVAVDRDILIYSRRDIEQWRDSRNHVAARALREGRVLYTRRDRSGVSPSSRPSRVREGAPPRPGPDVKQARLLLDMADGDIRMLRVACNPAEVPDEPFGFHVQQAAEKCLKAWIALLGEKYPLTHDLDELSAIIRRRDASVSQHADLAAFRPFAVKYRYGAMPPEAGSLDRRAAIRQAEALWEHVRGLLDE